MKEKDIVEKYVKWGNDTGNCIVVIDGNLYYTDNFVTKMLKLNLKTGVITQGPNLK